MELSNPRAAAFSLRTWLGTVLRWLTLTLAGTLHGFPEAAGVVAGDSCVLVTNRGGASVAWVDARTSGNPDSAEYRATTESIPGLDVQGG